MALTTNDYLIKLFFTISGVDKEKLNTFYYKANNVAATAQDLWDAFNTNVLTPLRDVVNGVTTFKRAEVFNLVDPTDFFVAPLTGLIGLRAGDECNSWMCWAYKLNRSISDRRNGRKAIGVPSDNDIVGGLPSTQTGNDIVSKLNVLASKLSEQIFAAGGSAAYDIAIPHSIEVIDAEHPLGHYVLDELDLTNGVSFERVSTQNSRKDF